MKGVIFMRKNTYKFTILALFAGLALSGCKKQHVVDLSGIHTTAAETMAAEVTTGDDEETTAEEETTASGSETQETAVSMNAASALSVRSQIATEKNGKISIEYPILSNLRDDATKDKVNTILKDLATRIVTDCDFNPETDKVSIRCHVISLDRTRAVLSYEGIVRMGGSEDQTNVFYTTTIDLNKGELSGLTTYADAYSMAGYILSDECVLYKPDKPAAAAAALEYLKGFDINTLTAILEACDFTVEGLAGFPQSFSYENQGDIFIVIPISHELGDYAIVRYSPDTK